MFVRRVTVSENRKKQVYLEIREHKPVRGKKSRLIARLGPISELAGNLDNVVQGLREFCEERFVSPKEITARRVQSWGPVLVARRLWDDMGLGRMVSEACGRDFEEVCFALVAQRLIDPRYEHGMDAWLEKTVVPRETGFGLDITRLQKMTGPVSGPMESIWDKALRRLAAKQPLFTNRIVADLQATSSGFTLAVLYQLATSFIEGMPGRSALTGRPAADRRRNINLYLGALARDGWPLAIHFFGGSEPTPAQVKQFMEASRRRFGFGKVLFVAPSATDEHKLQELQSMGIHFLAGVRRRRDAAAVRAIRSVGNEWVKIDDDAKIQEVAMPDQDYMSSRDEALHISNERYFLFHSREKAKQERASRTCFVSRALRDMEELKRAVDSGRLRKPATILARAERILSYHKSYRYISWRLTPEGQLEFGEEEAKSAVQKAYEGISVVKTTHPQISPSSVATLYYGLIRLESFFKEIYDTTFVRPVPLLLPELEERPALQARGNLFAGHLLATQLAYILRLELEKRLQQKRIVASAEDAVEALRSISLVELRLGQEEHLTTSPGTQSALKIIRALGIDGLQPDTRRKPSPGTS